MAASNEVAKHLKALHVPGRPLVLANVYDAITAETVTALDGAKALATASMAVALAAGETDDALDADTNLAAIRVVAKVAKKHGKPLTADFQDCYGEQLEDTVGKLIDTGAVGLNIEDTDKGTGELISAEQAAERVKRVLKVAHDKNLPDFVVNARADSLMHGGTIDDIIQRGKLYLAAGATTVFVLGVGRGGVSRDEVRQLTDAFQGRLNVSLILPSGAGLTVDELASIGVARISVGPGLQEAAMATASQTALSILA